MIRELVPSDDAILRKRAVPFNFENPQEDPEKLKVELLNAMVKYEGVGISACEIGVDLKVFAMRFNGDAVVCFNPSWDTKRSMLCLSEELRQVLTPVSQL